MMMQKPNLTRGVAEKLSRVRFSIFFADRLRKGVMEDLSKQQLKRLQKNLKQTFSSIKFKQDDIDRPHLVKRNKTSVYSKRRSTFEPYESEATVFK
jgi:hypothetical protein